MSRPGSSHGRLVFTRLSLRTPLLLLWLVAAGAFAAGCGDFTLFGGGDGGDGGDGGGGGGTCDHPFTDILQYTALRRLEEAETVGDPVALAVVPAGMSFEVPTDPGETVEPGDVLVADRSAGGNILVYPYQAGTVSDPSRMLLVDQAVDGLALFHASLEILPGDEQTFNLLFYTSAEDDILYMYDLDAVHGLVPNPFPISNFFMNNAMNGPAALALGLSGNKVAVFILNTADGTGQTIIRFTVDLAHLEQLLLETPEVLARNFENLQDLVYDPDGDRLFFSLDDPNFAQAGRVYLVEDALETTEVLDFEDDPVPFMEQMWSPNGLTLPTTDGDDSRALLLIAQQLTQERQIRQVDLTSLAVEDRGIPADGTCPPPNRIKAIGYDCTHGRVIYTQEADDPNCIGLWELATGGG